ncbi:MAG: DUF971 domain-containing protein [Bacteriovoracia bacterium]
MADLIPNRIEKHSDREMLMEWNTGERFLLPYFELRFHCPCANCVDEMTGVRTLKRESIVATVKPTAVELVGRYAIRVNWSDLHNTGMYPFDKLFELCMKTGQRIDN